MKCMSAARIKGTKRARPALEIPNEGPTRSVYDILQANKGLPVEIEFLGHAQRCVILQYLTDFYGLDIRQAERGDKRTHRTSKFMLAGEWFGRVYVDYVAERLEREAAQ